MSTADRPYDTTMANTKPPPTPIPGSGKPDGDPKDDIIMIIAVIALAIIINAVYIITYISTR